MKSKGVKHAKLASPMSISPPKVTPHSASKVSQMKMSKGGVMSKKKKC